jgi:hypothetical protein
VFKNRQQEIYRDDGLICHFEFEPMENGLIGIPVNNLLKINRVVKPMILTVLYKKLKAFNFLECDILYRTTQRVGT